MKALAQPMLILILALPGCATVRAPALDGVSWSGQDGSRLVADLRTAADQPPNGWLFKASQSEALGSFAYRKRSDAYDYSDRGYFAVDPKWRSGQTYIGLMKPGGVFCVVNPELQGDVTGNTVITYRIYDYCVQLHRQ
ncbi:MAG: hypothetical protein JF600_11235 [Xanthomonadales bacterium]|nr:hypothetical protein [Xanthomonadales bacterium]